MPITSPDDTEFDELCALLAASADANDRFGDWPGRQLDACSDAGVYEWFVPREHGGQGWSDVDIHRAYEKLASACLATTFCLTQPIGVARRLIACDNEPLRANILPRLLSGELFGAVGISQLTTSHLHLRRPVLAATESADGLVLDGYIPWVTGSDQADVILTGAVLDDHRQVLLLLPTDLPGVDPDPPAVMVGLTATHTGTVQCRGVRVGREWILAGPTDNVFGSSGAGTGGLQTSALALGLATAAIDYLEEEAQKRDELRAPLAGLRSDLGDVEAELFALAVGDNRCTAQDLRTHANSLVLRATQAALAAAKGAGYVAGHPAGRWCREALFFLVWSCPQPVMAANLCELAGLST